MLGNHSTEVISVCVVKCKGMQSRTPKLGIPKDQKVK